MEHLRNLPSAPSVSFYERPPSIAEDSIKEVTVNEEGIFSLDDSTEGYSSATFNTEFIEKRVPFSNRMVM